MVDSGFESDQSVFSPTLPCRAHQFASYWSSHFCKQLDFSGLLNQLLLVHWLYSFQNFDGVFFCFMFSPTLFVSIFIPIVLLYCHLVIRDKCLCSVHVFNWNFSKFLILSLFHALLVCCCSCFSEQLHDLHILHYSQVAGPVKQNWPKDLI